MSDPIERQAAIDAASYECGEFRGIFGRIEEKLKALPSAQPEQKKGVWIKTGQSFVSPEKFRNYSCSECGYDVDKTEFNYCPNCGTRMEEWE